MRVRADRYCFACGADNPRGLHLQFRDEGEDCVCDYTPDREHQGWGDMLHGGIAATVLDETMNQLLWRRGLDAVTARLSLRYRQPVPVERPSQIRVRLVERRRHVAQVAGEIVLEDGTVAVEASGSLMIVLGDRPGVGEGV